MTTIAATSSSLYAIPTRSLEPAKGKQTQSATEALLELTQTAHRAISSVESVTTAVAPAASVSASLAAALWNLDSGASTTTTPAAEMAAAQPEAAPNLENEVLKALAQALGVEETA
ncbi:hypothetical protein O3S81_15030 [Agrobacterium sp. SOY23]|uniref:hypothetical protein n=1 Tax=Agrobacterium sp. SOY23 TaxID=3014555 RepID=UPI0022AE9332|nr:hypothetical protein [Agrobacterium sp. SOY23]MCZ4431019.1 hypothetical protein [Agrobacterium sp. SOY23]